MSIFDQAFDEMSWEEVCYRLPGELAVNALKRRITNLETLSMFLECVHSQPSNIKPLNDHINSVLSDYSPDEIFEKFEQERHPLLFNWTNKENKERLKNDGKDKLTHKFLYNLSDANDVESLGKVFDHVLAQNPVVQSEALSVLNKISNKHFVPFLNRILSDNRPEVRALVLCVNDYGNRKLISKHQMVMGLKALSKIKFFDRAFEIVDFSLFSELKPLERLNTLKTYLSRFPKYKQIKIFDPMPTEDEINFVLFAGCIEHNELVQEISGMYKDITESEPPQENNEEDDA
jgi:hypothetical protein